MKRLSIILFLFIIYTSNAQENKRISVVYLHDGSMIKGQVVEDHTQSVVTITLIDGTQLIIPLKTVKSVIQVKENIEFLKNGKYVQTRGLYKSITVGTLTAWEDDEKEYILWGFSFPNLAVGYQFNQYLAVGGGVGMDIYDFEFIPVFADFRGYIFNSRVSPYYALQAGYGISADLSNSLSSNESSKGGAMIHPSIGLRFASFRQTKFIMEAGYKFQYETRTNDWNESVDNIVYRRLSLKFGVLF